MEEDLCSAKGEILHEKPNKFVKAVMVQTTKRRTMIRFLGRKLSEGERAVLVLGETRL